MDFSNRSAQSQSYQPTSATPSGAAAPQPNAHKSKDKKSLMSGSPQWYKAALSALLVLGVLLLLAVVGLLYTSKPETQGKYVDSSKLQAVFLNSGQVYFGNIRTLNNQYFVLGNVYYLQSASNSTDSKTTTQNSNISLVKLGCELHQPYDQMVINRDQVTFWENLKSDGQVAKAVADFKDKYPNGQTCSTATNATSTNVQGTTQNSTTTKP